MLKLKSYSFIDVLNFRNSYLFACGVLSVGVSQVGTAHVTCCRASSLLFCSKVVGVGAGLSFWRGNSYMSVTFVV